MISTSAKIAIALAAVGAASLGVAIGFAAAPTFASTSKPTGPAAPTAPPPTPGPGGAAWTPATTINPGQRVRISVSLPDLMQLAQSIGTTADFAGWLNILALPAVQAVLQSSLALAWGPGPGGVMMPSALPSDWPSDDTTAATEYHAEFVYRGTAPLDLAHGPIPVRAWVAA